MNISAVTGSKLVPTLRTRYPGAQPFADDEFSRRVFFGREQASKILTDQILANRMVVVYAKSGLGKTSLLNAGVAPRLREDGYLPLSVRVNAAERGPLLSILDEIKAEAERQKVEYSPGSPESLWSFFKTAEFWRGDLLLTPVLILDQFEELFTLHTEQARGKFLSELSFLVRGIRPDGAVHNDETLTESPPTIRVVLSLREDHLGLLEEAADHLPQILDHRYRLAPLTLDAAAAAMTGPAEIDDPVLETRPFRYLPETVSHVLSYLSRQRGKSVGHQTRYVEPFQLQLICQRVEQIVAKRQQLAADEITITMTDIGGEAALRETLKDFYTSSVRSLPGRRIRRTARRLCEEFLISPEGRRLSLEENEIQRQLALRPETLRMLVGKRLLRSDNRSDSTYYELSHDALIEPVLATRRWRALLVGWLGLAGTSLALLVLVLAAVFGVKDMLDKQEAKNTMESLLALTMVFLPLSIILVALWRRNLLSVRRYRPRTADEIADTIVAGKTRMSVVYGASGFFFGGTLILLAIIIAVYYVIGILNAYGADLPSPDPFVTELRDSIAQIGIRLDTIVTLISIPVVVSAGVRLWRRGTSSLLQAPLRVRSQGTDALRSGVLTRSSSFAGIGFAAVIIALLAAVLAVGLSLVGIACAYQLDGELPRWIPANWFNTAMYSCNSAHETGYGPEYIFEWLYVLAFVGETTRLLLVRFRRLKS